MTLFGAIFGGGHAPAAPTIIPPIAANQKHVARKFVTPKWLDWLLVAILAAIPVLYACGVSVEVGPSMNHLGSVYITKWGTLPTQPGQIIRLAPADLPTWRKYCVGSIVKRFIGFTPDGRLKYEGDNSEWSADNRDGLKPVPPDYVAGVVTHTWSPERFVRAFSAQGRFRNWIETNLVPSKTHWVDDRCCVVERESFVQVYMQGTYPRTLIGRFAGVSGAIVKVWRPELAEVKLFDVSNGKTRVLVARESAPGDLEVTVRKGKGIGFQTMLTDQNLVPPFSISFGGEKRKIEKVIPLPKAKDGKPGVMFGVFPPFDVKEGKTIKVTMVPLS